MSDMNQSHNMGVYLGKEKYYDIFISHNYATSEQAQQLYDILKDMNEKWNIFLDKSGMFESSHNMESYQNESIDKSKVLIFIARSADEVNKDGYGCMHAEVTRFNSRCNRRYLFDPECNIAYFGIFLCDRVDFDCNQNIFTGGGNNHLVLGENASINENRNRIINRVKAIFNDPGLFSNSYVPYVLDKSQSYFNNNIDFFNNQEYINTTFSATNGEDKERINYKELVERIKLKHTVILGEDGGIGKTTLLKKLFCEFLQNDSNGKRFFIPIFIQANKLSSLKEYLTDLSDAQEDNVFIRYVEQMLLEKEFDNVRYKDFKKSFSSSCGTVADEKDYLFLIDGINEVPSQLRNKISEHLQALCSLSACRIVIATRDIPSGLVSEFEQIYAIERLSRDDVKGYLKNKGIDYSSIDKTLYNILNIPMFLKIFCDSHDKTVINKGELLNGFLGQQFFADKNDKLKIADVPNLTILHHFLPYIAYGMVRKEAFVISERDLRKQIIDCCKSIAEDDDYLGYYEQEYQQEIYDEFSNYIDSTWDLLKEGAIASKKRKYIDSFKRYTINKTKLLRPVSLNEEESYEFSHHIYRDFFCSRHIVESINRFAKNKQKTIFDVLDRKHFEEDVRLFTADLFAKNGKPFYNRRLGEWDYSCNKNNALIKALNNLKFSDNQNAALIVSNILNILSRTRCGDLSNLDLSDLDLTQSDLKCYVFSRTSNGKEYATSFKNSKINFSNIYSNNSFFYFTAACICSDKIAILDCGDNLILWRRNMFDNTPILVRRGVCSGINKMVFSPDGEFIYAKTIYDVIKIEYKDSLKQQVLYSSAVPINDIYLRNGELLFTTIFDPLNKKSISNPNESGTVPLRLLSAVGAVNDAEDTAIAPANAVFNYFKLYKNKNGEWQEENIAYQLFLEEYFVKIEEALKVRGLYDLFPDEQDSLNPQRKQYFVSKQSKFSDRNHDWSSAPSRISDEIKKYINKKSKVTPSLKKHLANITKEFEQKILDFTSKNPLVMQLFGRELLSVDYSPEKNTFLLSLYYFYEKQIADKNNKDTRKEKKTNWIMCEFDPQTSEIQNIGFNSKGQKIKAYYQNGEIVSFDNSAAAFYDTQNNLIRMFRSKEKRILILINHPIRNTFLAVAGRFIYEIDFEDAKILRGIPFQEKQPISRVNYVFDDSKEKIIGWCLKQISGLCVFLDLDLNISHIMPDNTRLVQRDRTEVPSLQMTQKGDIQVKASIDNIVFYKNGKMIKKIPICYKMFITNCDFTGVKGDLVTESDARNILISYGAKTDFSVEIESKQEEPPRYLPLPFDKHYEPLMPLDRASLKYCQSLCVVEKSNRSDEKQNMHKKQETTLRETNLNYRNYSFDYADFLIVHWVYRLKYAVRSTIVKIVQATLAQTQEYFKPLGEEDIVKKIEVLSEKLMLLEMFEIKGDNQPNDFYKISNDYGRRFLSNLLNISNKEFSKTKNPILCPAEDVLKALAFNEWFAKVFENNSKRFLKMDFSSFIDSDESFFGRAIAEAVLKTENAHYLVCSLRRNYNIEEGVSKYMRLKSITDVRDFIYVENTRQKLLNPQIILLCEDYEQCLQTYKLIKKRGVASMPLFSYDALLTEKCSAEVFEFPNDDSAECIGMSIV